MKTSLAQAVSATSLQSANELTAITGFAQLLLAIAGVLFAFGLLLLILINRREARAANATLREARRALRARLGA